MIGCAWEKMKVPLSWYGRSVNVTGWSSSRIPLSPRSSTARMEVRSAAISLSSCAKSSRSTSSQSNAHEYIRLATSPSTPSHAFAVAMAASARRCALSAVLVAV